jgi:hypothetical protein
MLNSRVLLVLEIVRPRKFVDVPDDGHYRPKLVAHVLIKE